MRKLSCPVLLLPLMVMSAQNCLADTIVKVFYNGSDSPVTDALITAEIPGVGITKKGKADENGEFKTPIPLLPPDKIFRISATLSGMTQAVSYSSPKKVPSEIVFKFIQPDIDTNPKPSPIIFKNLNTETQEEKGAIAFQLKLLVGLYHQVPLSDGSLPEAMGQPVTNADIKIRYFVDDDRPSAWISKNSGRTGQISMDDTPVTVHMGSVVHVEVADEGERLLGKGSRQVTRDIEGDSIAVLVATRPMGL